MVLRLLVTAGVLASTFVLLHGTIHVERKAVRRPIHTIPLTLGPWQGRDITLEPRIIKAVSVDDYVSRVYEDGGKPVQIYVGYYSSQQSGEAIHSPKNCLPGAGWEPVREGRLKVELTPGRPVVINDYVVEKEATRLLVLYWYQGRGRITASEYWAKVWMIVDGIRRGRTDGALVRIVTTTEDGDSQAHYRSVAFLREVYPYLTMSLPD